jgi:hypothetical protein
MTIWRALHEQLLYPYHLQRGQDHMPADFPARENFSRCFVQRSAEHFFVLSLLFKNEARFSRDEIINIHNQHQWAEENPHGIIHSRHQQQFSIDARTVIVGDCLVGPHVLPRRLTGNRFRDDLPNLLEDVPLAVRARIWYMHDGAPAHFSRAVRAVLNNTHHDRWIGRRGPIAWPPRSPDLNPLSFYLWGHLNVLLYAAAVDNEEKRHFTIALWMPVRLSATTPASLNGSRGP